MAQAATTSTSKVKIRDSLSRWTGNIPKEHMPLFRDFVEETLSRLRGPFLAHHPPNQVLAYLEEAFDFAQRRTTDTLAIDLRRRRTKGVAVFINMDDQPFIVDTARLFLRNHRADYWGGFNLVFRALRDEQGNLRAIGTDDGRLESLVMLEADRGDIEGDLTVKRDQLEYNLTLARAMVRDFRPMTRTIERFIERCEVISDRQPDRAESMRETAAFLKWLLSENFVFMGVHADEPLGIQTIDGPMYSDASGDWAQPHLPETVRVRKSHRESPVHRNGRIDEILVTIDEERQLFIRGMFTYRAVTQPSRNVPILRGVLAAILAEQTTGPGSFRYKGIANVFDSLPTEFLFTATGQAIAEMVDLVFESEQQQEVGVTFLMNGQDSAFCLVAMPKTQFGDELRRQLEREIVDTLDATYTDHGLFFGRYETVLLYYYLTGVTNPGHDAVQRLTERIRQVATPWLARLWEALAAAYGEAKADRLADTYGRAFPPAWTRATTAVRAVRDIAHLESLADAEAVSADLYEDHNGQLTLRIYQARDLVLSEILPVLEHFGLLIVDSYATTVNSRGGQLHLDTFRVGGDADTRKQLLERGALITDALQAVFTGRVTDSRMNGLVCTAGLTWQEVDIVRSYCSYAQQLQLKLSPARVTAILLENPQMTRSVVDLFHARFDPDLDGDRDRLMEEATERATDELRYLIAHDEDLAFSTILELIQATLRTNYYRTDRNGWYLSYKFDCSKIRGLGEGAPMFEIFVQSPDVHGVHLRFGTVARGGLRWSDRSDFRTEVLGLATTQQVKNVVIVPTGSKGGFHIKQPARDRSARRAQADELYKTFIRGLLDLTDNTVDGELVHPPRVVHHDGGDPYLVVAADKGTAHLSDTANAISESYGFWLGDAFASGGSNGYDHKKVGITARGAWVLVRRHFAERGVDPYNEEFTAVGIGDMGGDVFGNGLLESEHTRLLAAFNHLHIFLDPDPDPATSYGERKRLFETQGGWDQYDQSTISEGGGVFDRRAKSVPLSPQAAAMLGLSADEAQPEEVIRAILKMEVDLFWNGGIGTYVKASWETDADADDRSNDAVRIDATELRARIVGEGGNLGFTQQGRIEADQCGVALNTDAIDNSGGVDMSDHEVNLKILLNQRVARGDMTVDERNTLLEEMTDEVAELVLADNDAHGRQLSRDKRRSKNNVFQFGRAIAFVERAFGRDRATLNLPSDEELKARAGEGQGLTRPELAVLSAWVKMYVKQELMAGDPKQLPGYRHLLHTYFPERIRESFADDIDSHMLADEIAVTVATTNMIADAGAAFFPLCIETTGAPVQSIAEAYLKAQYLAFASEVRSTLEELRTTVMLPELYKAWVMVDKGVQETALYWLSTRASIPDNDILGDMRDAAAKVYELQASDVVEDNRVAFEALRTSDIPDDVAHRIVRAQYINLALTVWAESRSSGRPFADIAVRHMAIGRASRLQEVLDSLTTRSASGRWDPIALRILHTRFHNLLRRLVGVCQVDAEVQTVDQLEPVLAKGELSEVRSQVDDLLEGDEAPSVATLLVLMERLDALVSRMSAT